MYSSCCRRGPARWGSGGALSVQLQVVPPLALESARGLFEEFLARLTPPWSVSVRVALLWRDHVEGAAGLEGAVPLRAPPLQRVGAEVARDEIRSGALAWPKLLRAMAPIFSSPFRVLGFYILNRGRYSYVEGSIEKKTDNMPNSHDP